MLSTPADLLLRSCGLLLSLFAVTACALAQPASGSPPEARSSVLASPREMPVRLCVPVAAEAWQELRRGETRLVLHLRNQTPSYIYSPSFRVSLAGLAAKPVEVDQLSMHPDIVGSESGRPDPQHFAIDLRPHLPAATDRSTLCVEVGIDLGEQGALPEGWKDDQPLQIWATVEPLTARNR